MEMTITDAEKDLETFDKSKGILYFAIAKKFLDRYINLCNLVLDQYSITEIENALKRYRNEHEQKPTV